MPGERAEQGQALLQAQQWPQRHGQGLSPAIPCPGGRTAALGSASPEQSPERGWRLLPGCSRATRTPLSALCLGMQGVTPVVPSSLTPRCWDLFANESVNDDY